MIEIYTFVQCGSPQQLGSDTPGSQLSPVSGTCTYEPPRLAHHSSFWCRPSCTHTRALCLPPVIQLSHTVHAGAGLDHPSPMSPTPLPETRTHSDTHAPTHSERPSPRKRVRKMVGRKTGQSALIRRRTWPHLRTDQHLFIHDRSLYPLTPLSPYACSSPNYLDPSFSTPLVLAPNIP